MSKIIHPKVIKKRVKKVCFLEELHIILLGIITVGLSVINTFTPGDKELFPSLNIRSFSVAFHFTSTNNNTSTCRIKPANPLIRVPSLNPRELGRNPTALLKPATQSEFILCSLRVG